MPSARAATFFFLSIACVYLVTQSSGVIRFLWASIAWSFLGVSGAYALRRPELLGKQPSGTLRLHFLLLWPAYFLLTWGIWFLARLVPGYPHSHEIVPGLWLGAWPNHPSTFLWGQLSWSTSRRSFPGVSRARAIYAYRL